MRSIRSTNNARRRAARRRTKALRIARRLREFDAGVGEFDDGDCGQCEGTGTIVGGLSGDGPDEMCPVCDGSGVLPDDDD